MKKIILLLTILATGCASRIEPPPSFKYTEIPTDFFTLASWQKIEKPSGLYKVYIEGDGYSFTSRGKPTSNPTPRSDTLRKIAFTDPSPNVIYLGRPCQFVTDQNCREIFWTTGRFAPEVISSTATAIKKIAPAKDVKLIGFSGGAQVAGLVAVLHPDITVKKLITIAGNIDHETWASRKKLIPLNDSLSLSDHRDKYLSFPQLHYIGSKDKVIPPQVTYDFIEDKNLIIELPNASHSDGWDGIKTD